MAMDQVQFQQYLAETIRAAVAASLQAQLDAQAQMHAQTQAQQAMHTPVPPDRDHHRKLEVKNFVRVNKFDGKESEFQDFAFQMKLAVKTTNREAFQMLEETCQQKEPINSGQLLEERRRKSDLGVNVDYEKLSFEFYDILGMSVTGEALTIVRGVHDMNGAEAWRRLNRRYAPRTPARTLVKLMDVLNPGKAKTVHELAHMLEVWELKVNVLEKDFSENIGQKIRAAVLLGMCMQELQDIIVQRTENIEEYSKVKDVVMNFIDNRKSHCTPSPMDIGQCYLDGGDQQFQWSEDVGEQYEEIGVIGKGASCYNCGGQGHYARDCGTPKGKGKGKGGKGMQKGEYGQKGMFQKGNFDKNGGKGYEKGKGKGKGKAGFTGECWRCGKVGHRQDQCRVRIEYVDEVNNEDYESGEVEEQIGGVWQIGSIDEEAFEETVGLGDDASPAGDESKCEECVGWSHVVSKKNARKIAHANRVMTKENFIGSVKVDDMKVIGHGEITIDSGAAESVWPVDYMKNIPTKVTDKNKENMVYVAANGSRMKNMGKKEVHFRSSGGGGVGSMDFQVTNVQKPLASVRRIVEKGNKVVFGGDHGQSYIEGVNGKKVMLSEKNGIYTLPVEYLQEMNAKVFVRPA